MSFNVTHGFRCVSDVCRYTPSQQEALVSNVFLTGGNMLYPGMKERVERELLAMRPFQSHYKVESSLTDGTAEALCHLCLGKVIHK